MLGLGLSIPQIAVRGTRFSPGSLFAAGEQGAWYDPSDFSTLFQDSAGTTPVTAVEQPVGLMLDKSKGLVLGPELVTNGTFDTDTAWTKGTGWTISGGVATTASSNSGTLDQSITVVAGKIYRVKYTITGWVAGQAQIGFSGGTTVLGPLSGTGNGTRTFYISAVTGNNLFRVFKNSSLDSFSIDNISVRELAGNHAFQSTPTSRPTLSSRVNLLTKTEEFNDAVWNKTSAGAGVSPVVTANAGVAPNGTTTADRVQFDCTDASNIANRSIISQSVSVVSGVNYKRLIYIKAYDLANVGKTVRLVSDGVTSSQQIVTLTSDWQELVFTGAASAASANVLIDTRGTLTTQTADVLVWGADLRVANDGVGLPAYQRVDTATSYDTAGFPLYLRFDGSDDSFLTNSVDFTGTDKMTVWAGVRKLSDATVGIFVELSADTNINNGSWFLACFNATSRDYFSNARGTLTLTNPGFFTPAPAPDTSVLAVTVNLGTDLITLQRNTVAGTNSIGSLGGGNFGNYPLYIGRRNNATLPYNGRLYSLIIRGAQSTATQIAQTESYVNSKTRAF
jgi:hypothetical protein